MFCLCPPCSLLQNTAFRNITQFFFGILVVTSMVQDDKAALPLLRSTIHGGVVRLRGNCLIHTIQVRIGPHSHNCVRSDRGFWFVLMWEM